VLTVGCKDGAVPGQTCFVGGGGVAARKKITYETAAGSPDMANCDDTTCRTVCFGNFYIAVWSSVWSSDSDWQCAECKRRNCVKPEVQNVPLNTSRLS
jgi:hypothetical protein